MKNKISLSAKVKQAVFIAAAFTLLFVFNAVSAAAANDTVHEFKHGSAFIEAESAKLKTYCTVIEREDASGGKSVLLGEKKTASRASTPLLRTDRAIEYKINVDYAGRYFIYARVLAHDAETNQVSVIINNSNASGKANIYGEYTWIALGSTSTGYYLTPGVKSISLVPVTDGIEVDEILVTRKAGKPVGKDIMDDSLTTGVDFTYNFNETDKGFAKKILINENEHDISDIKPVEGHPRIYFRKEDIPRILENAQKPENISAWNVHLEYVEDRSQNPSTEIIEAQALDYALRGNLEAGKNAVKEALEFYYDKGQTYAKLTGDTYIQIGQAVVTLSCVYDWCYDLLTEDEKEYIVDEMIMLMSQGNFNELMWPPYTENGFTTHQAERTLQHDVMMMGIAIYDERQDIYEFAAGRFFNEFLEYRRWIFAGHWFNQGYNYLDYRLKWEGFTTFLIDKGLGIPNIYGDGLAGVMYSRLYTYRPDGYWLPEGDAQQSSWDVSSKGDVATWLAASYYKDPYLKQAYAEFSGNMKFSKRSSASPNGITTSNWLLFNDPDLEGKSERELPLSKYYPSPAGNMTARTGWTYGTDSPTVVAQMKLDEYTVNGHDHKDSGSFMLYYKGYLAREAGIYKIAGSPGYRTANIGSSEFLSHHHSFFYTRAIAHNCMLVYDPDEKFYEDRNERNNRPSSGPYYVDELPNDGGQKQNIYNSNYVTDFNLIRNDDHKTAEVLGHEYGEDQIEPNFTYLKGDLSWAYSDKISEYERSFMFLNFKDEDHPAALIVFDRLKTSDPSFKKTWQMYGSNYPKISNSRVVFEDVRSNPKGTLNYNGRLTLDTLMPAHENVSYNVVGGDGQWALVDGGDYPAKMPDNPDSYRPEYENWRLEITPKTENQLDYFLNVMQVGDADGVPAYDTKLIETDSLAGCVVGDRVVVFGKRRDRTSQATEFSFEGDGEFEVTVADMQAGKWSVYCDGTHIGDYGATVDGGVVTFRGRAGSYRLVYKNSTAKVYEEPTLKSKSRVSLYYTGTPGYAPEAPYVNEENILMLPARSIFEKGGAEVTWDAENNCVKVTKDGNVLSIREGDVLVDKSMGDMEFKAQLSAAPVIDNGTMMVPVDCVPHAVNVQAYAFDDLSQKLNITFAAESESEYSMSEDYKKENDGSGGIIYALPDPEYVKEIFIKGSENGTCRIAYSVDAEEWIEVGNSIVISSDFYTEISIGEWCNYIKIYDTNADISEFKRLSQKYTDDTYYRIFSVEWSAENNSSETGLQAIDGNVDTLWSAEGMGQWLLFDLGAIEERPSVEVFWNKSDERQQYFDVLGSNDKENWEYIIKDGASTGTAKSYEGYTFDGSPKYRYIKIEMFQTSTGTFNAIKEIRFLKTLETEGDN